MSRPKVAYYRVSTARQGQSGLGLDAQQKTVEDYLKRAGGELVESVVEVESGRNCERPHLARAIAHTKLVGGELIVAKLDRLARDASFILKIVDSGVPVIFCDLPELATGDPIVGRLTLTILAAIAEFEGRRISQRVREALSRLKERNGGVATWFRQNLTDDHRRKGNAVAVQTHRRKFREFVDGVRPLAASLRAGRTLSETAIELNRRGIKTRRGKPWTGATVHQLLSRGANEQR